MSFTCGTAADSSFEKVYEKLQKEILTVESENESLSHSFSSNLHPGSSMNNNADQIHHSSSSRNFFVSRNCNSQSFAFDQIVNSETLPNASLKEDGPWSQFKTSCNLSSLGQGEMTNQKIVGTEKLKDISFFDFPSEVVDSCQNFQTVLYENNLDENLIAYESDSVLEEYDDDAFWNDGPKLEHENINGFVTESQESVHLPRGTCLNNQSSFISSRKDRQIERLSAVEENLSYTLLFEPNRDHQYLAAAPHVTSNLNSSYSKPSDEYEENGIRAPVEKTTAKKSSRGGKTKKPISDAAENGNRVSNKERNSNGAVTSSSQKGHEIKSGAKFDVYKHIKQDGDNVMSENSSSKVYNCGICGNFATLSKLTLEKHWKLHYKERPLKCQHCEKSFTNQSNLNKHLRTHEHKRYMCVICCSNFRSKTDLSTHNSRRHSSSKLPHQCPECSYTTAEICKLKRHLRSHTGERPFKCTLCTYSCADNFKLKRHMFTHTGEKRFECPVCHLKFTQASSLKAHLLGHTGDKPKFQCEYCEVTCSRRSDLNQHMLKLHTSQVPQKCRLCNASFPDRHNLKEHMRKHRGDKKYNCDLCSYKSQHKKYLNAHRMTHTGEKPFACSICGMQFRTEAHLKRHVEKSHVEDKPVVICEPPTTDTEEGIDGTIEVAATASADVASSGTASAHSTSAIATDNYSIVYLEDNYVDSDPSRTTTTTRIMLCCPLCNELTSSERDLQQHLEVAHSSQNRNIAIKKPLPINRLESPCPDDLKIGHMRGKFCSCSTDCDSCCDCYCHQMTEEEFVVTKEEVVPRGISSTSSCSLVDNTQDRSDAANTSMTSSSVCKNSPKVSSTIVPMVLPPNSILLSSNSNQVPYALTNAIVTLEDGTNFNVLVDSEMANDPNLFQSLRSALTLGPSMKFTWATDCSQDQYNVHDTTSEEPNIGSSNSTIPPKTQGAPQERNSSNVSYVWDTSTSPLQTMGSSSYSFSTRDNQSVPAVFVSSSSVPVFENSSQNVGKIFSTIDTTALE